MSKRFKTQRFRVQVSVDARGDTSGREMTLTGSLLAVSTPLTIRTLRDASVELDRLVRNALQVID